LRIEEQGRYLQMMFEKQRKMEEDRSKTPVPNSDGPSLSPAKTASLVNEKSESSEQDKSDKGSGSSDACASAKPLEENPRKEEKQAFEDHDEDGSTPPAKRSKADESSTS
jgi:hypothetical protein